ncbi:MAG: hypothetical protein J0H11_04595 [Rhizobiales bacterium]|nr:hypothetical protein [Hyphomicrobiales bacterium]
MIKLASLAFLALLLPGLAAAAETAPSRISGTIVALEGNMLTVRGADGTETSIRLPEKVSVTALAERRLDDIKAGDYVGSAAVAGPDGKLHAQEVHIFTETMRGVGEGHRPMSGPNQTMTNATVTTVISDPVGHTLKLRYKDGEQDIEVGPDARIVAIIPGDRSLLKTGAAVSVFVGRSPDGTLTARAVQAEKDGVKPL